MNYKDFFKLSDNEKELTFIGMLTCQAEELEEMFGGVDKMPDDVRTQYEVTMWGLEHVVASNMEHYVQLAEEEGLFDEDGNYQEV